MKRAFLRPFDSSEMNLARDRRILWANVFTVIVAFSMSVCGPINLAAADYPGASVISFHGYSDCILLENDVSRAVLCPRAGGRVLEFSLNGKNALYLNPEDAGWEDASGTKSFGLSAGRFDIGPERVIPRHPVLWAGRWEGEIIGPRAARLTSQHDSATGTQLIREFHLDETTAKLSCKQIIKNISDETKEWCHWSRTFSQGGGICVIPLTPNSRFPNKYVMYGPGPVINYQPEDPEIRERDGFLEIIGTPQYPKLGMDSYAGWFGYLTPNDLLFVKKYPTFPDRVYNEVAGLTISIWYFEKKMTELEPIGPREKIGPGQSASFTEEWYLKSYEFPEDRRNVDLQDIAKHADQMR